MKCCCLLPSSLEVPFVGGSLLTVGCEFAHVGTTGDKIGDVWEENELS